MKSIMTMNAFRVGGRRRLYPNRGKRGTQENGSLISGGATESRLMQIHTFPPSRRVVGIVALYLALDCQLKPVDKAINPRPDMCR
jgi:hypothetical protein